MAKKRYKKTVRGNTVNQDIVQINMKVKKYGSKPINDLLKTQENKEETKKEGKEDK